MTNRIVKVTLRGEIGDLTTKMTAAGRSVASTADKMTAASKDAEKFRHGLTAVGDSAGKLGLVAGAGLGAVVLATANFDQAMSNVAAATHESVQNMEQLREAAIQAGAETVFSASEAAGAIESLAKAGVSTTDVLNGGLDGALSLASAGSLEVADAADIAATALTQFKLKGKDVPHVADLLAAGAGKAQGEVSDLGFALKQSGLVAAQMGVSIEETTGTLAAFASAGLLGSDAGTSFKTMLLRLANPADEAADLMKKLGISAYDASGNFVGITSLAGQLKTALGGQTQATRDAALATIFGSDAIRAANVLYDQGAQGIQDWTKKVDDSGFAAETASTRLDNLKGDLEQFRGSLETALINTGEGSQSSLRGLVQNLTEVVNAYNKLPSSVQGSVANVLAGTALLGGSIFVFSRITQSIANTRKALDELGPAGVRAGTMVRTGLAIGATVIALRSFNDAMGAIFDRDWDSGNVQRALESLGSGGDVTGHLDGLGTALRDLQHSNFFEEFPQEFTRAFGLFGDTELDKAQKKVKELDESLAAMVESGHAEDAAAALVRIVEIGEKSGVAADDTKRAFDQYQLAVENAGRVSLTLEDAFSGVLGLMTSAPGAIDPATGAINSLAQSQEEQAKAAEELRQAATDQAQEFVGLGDKVDDAKTSLGGWIDELEKQAKALEAFTANAKKAGENGLAKGLIEELKAEGPAGALRLQQLADASESEIKRANKAWRDGKRAVREYVDYVTAVPPTRIEIENREALRKLRNVLAEARRTQAALLRLGVKTNGSSPQDGGKDGDPDTPYWSGGYTGDGNVYDRAGVVHRREFVMDAQATAGNVGYLEQVRQSLRAGTRMTQAAQVYVAAPASPAIDYERLARAMAAVRPMYGDVYQQPHDYNEFRRQMEIDRRMSAVDGVSR